MPSTTYVVPSIGRVEVRVKDEFGCNSYASIDVLGCCSAASYYVPNIFTPESEPPNNLLRAYPSSYCAYYKMRIYDRWGALLFETTNIEQGWDGIFRQKKCPAGVYVWVIESADSQSAIPSVKTGSITLIR
jgi:gliding motility-associated-like protein